jgi:Gas vesicle synthesis protein GvpO
VPTRRAVRSSRKTDDDRGAREPDDELAEEPDDELDDEPDDELDDEPDDELDDELDDEPDDEPDDELDDEPDDEPEAVADDDDGDSGRRARRRRDGGLTAAKAGRLAMRQIGELTGKQAEGITGVEPGEDGWIVGVEVVEDRRVPSSADILATYETEVDMDGELVSYRRVRRYSRGRGDSEG